MEEETNGVISSPVSSTRNRKDLRPLNGCGCARRCLFKKIGQSRAEKLRNQYLEFTRKERDIILFQSLTVKVSKDGVSKRKTSASYRVNAGSKCKKICRKAFNSLFGISEDKITRMIMGKKTEDSLIPVKLRSGGDRRSRTVTSDEE